MREAAERVELIVLYASAGLRAEPEVNVILTHRGVVYARFIGAMLPQMIGLFV